MRPAGSVDAILEFKPGEVLLDDGTPEQRHIVVVAHTVFVIAAATYRINDHCVHGGAGLSPPFPTLGRSLRGIVVRSNGNYALLGDPDRGIYEYDGESWGSADPYPVGVTQLQGISEDNNGNLVAVDVITQRIYTRQEATLVWDAGIAIPPAEVYPTSVTVGAGQVYYVTGRGRLLYARTMGVWDAGMAMPVASGTSDGIGIQPNGTLLLSLNNTDRIYSLVQDDAMLPTARGLVRWTGTQWENL